MQHEKSQTARRHDRECKENAGALGRGGRTIGSVAHDLGVTTWLLGRWVQLARAESGQREPDTLAAESDEQRELRRLRQESGYLRQQRDIPGKSVGHLVSGSASTRYTQLQRIARKLRARQVARGPIGLPVAVA